MLLAFNAAGTRAVPGSQDRPAVRCARRAGEAAPAAESAAFAHLPKVVHLGLKVAQQAGGVGRAGLARVRLDERAQLLPRRAGGQPLHGDDVEVDLGRQVAWFLVFGFWVIFELFFGMAARVRRGVRRDGPAATDRAGPKPAEAHARARARARAHRPGHRSSRGLPSCPRQCCARRCPARRRRPRSCTRSSGRPRPRSRPPRLRAGSKKDGDRAG